VKVSIALYPFSSSLLPTVRYFDQLQNQYTLDKLYSLPGSGLIGKDAGYACNHPPIGRIVSGEIDINDAGWNTLIVAMPQGEKSEIGNHIYTQIRRVLVTGKSVVFCGDCGLSISKKMQVLKHQYSNELLILPENPLFSKSTMFYERYRQVEVPVILIGGLIESSDTLEVLLGIIAELRKRQLYPSAIVKDPVGRLFGLHSYDSIFTTGTTEIQKIEALNRFALAVVREERPNVILVEAPDAVMRFNEIAPNGFGIQTYLLTQALRIDYFVCCVPLELLMPPLLEAFSKDFSVRLGSPIHAVQVSNVIGDSAEILQQHAVSYAHTTLDHVQEKIEQEKTISMFPLFDVMRDGGEGLVKYLGLC